MAQAIEATDFLGMLKPTSIRTRPCSRLASSYILLVTIYTQRIGDTIRRQLEPPSCSRRGTSDTQTSPEPFPRCKTILRGTLSAEFICNRGLWCVISVE